MSKLFLVISHSLTDEQVQDAKKSFNIEEVVSLPDNLIKIWGNIPPEIPKVNEYLKEIKKWLLTNCHNGDYILIQGEFGSTCILVNFAFKNNFIPIYATTKRIIEEEVSGNKVINKRIFKHVRFRIYEK